jgi:hypothetical protein
MRKAGVRTERSPYLGLALLTVGALFVHGYHPGIEDAEIYTPGIKKLLNPSLYSFNSEFFLNHARLTLFDELIAASVRATHLPFDVMIFGWYLASIFLMLLACWRLSVECFQEPEARWAAVATVAALLTLPVAGTSLYIADQYVTSRSIVTFAVLFAVLGALKGRMIMWALWSAVALCVHPLMGALGVTYTLILWWMKRRHISLNIAYSLLPAALPVINLNPVPSRAYQQAVSTRSYFFLLQWEWYEWLGAIAPFFLLWLIWRSSKKEPKDAVGVMSLSLIAYGWFYIALAFVLTIPVYFQGLARLQPMRSLHLLYILMFLFVGGLLGRHVLRRQPLRWIALLAPICVTMTVAQRQILPGSPHIEWPNKRPTNDWLLAFDWIRGNTPVDAIFAVDPQYMNKDDQHGFRAIAERSRLADAVKDSGAVTMFPDSLTPDHWLEQLTAESGWEHLQETDFRRLKQIYGVSWVLSERSQHLNFACPYENHSVQVCRVD